MSIGWIRGARVALATAWLALVGVAAPALGQGTSVTSVPVSAFDFEYGLEHPDQPRIAELEALEVVLRHATGGLMPPHPETENIRFPLGRVPVGLRFFPGTLRYVNQQVLAVFQERGIGGVLILLPDLEEGTGRDLRTAGNTRLRVHIWTGRIESVATVADGDRFGSLDEAGRSNHPAHAFIRQTSPVTPGGRNGLLRVKEIEDFAFALSRHPGRRVDALLRPGELPGTTRVDYHVAESKPWMVYAQTANNGTDATTDWRQRFGFSHNQLTGNDDIFKLDYMTGEFDDLNGVWGSYSGPLYRVPRMRWSALGSYSDYDATEVGVSRLNLEGDQWEAGGRLHLNVLQMRELFVDVVAGLRWRNVGVDSAFRLGGISSSDGADDDFFLPEVGLEIRRDTFISSSALEIMFDTNLSSVAGTDTDDLRALGTLDADKSFSRLRWNGAVSIYLEPALRWRQFIDPSTTESSTLAHELLIATRGMISLGDRLVPQFQQVAGGLATVRGYEQSISAGDQVGIGSVEYRIHLPRLLAPGGPPYVVPVLGKLKLRPEHAYGQPDWDFIVKVFADAARVVTVDRQDFEANDTLVGLGFGVELHVLRNFQARLDIAWPQERLEGRDTDSAELHALFTLMY
jgi:hemolysin activation/secretion protein